jgi:hypothetical protein
MPVVAQQSFRSATFVAILRRYYSLHSLCLHDNVLPFRLVCSNSKLLMCFRSFSRRTQDTYGLESYTTYVLTVSLTTDVQN